MAKKIIELKNELPGKFTQNKNLSFEAGGKRYTVADFEEEVTAKQTEDILSVVNEILPALASVDNNDNINALQIIVSAITSERALLRRLLAILFLPENDRVYKRNDVEEKIELLGDLPNKHFLPLLSSVKDAFAFVAQTFPNATNVLNATINK
jgi:hypothetical protein